MAKNKCPWCGNNPVPHFLNWYFESINVAFTPIRKFLLYNKLTVRLKHLAIRYCLGNRLVDFCAGIGALTFQKNRAKCGVPRAQVLWEEAEHRGINFSELLLFGRPFDTYMAEKNGTAIVFTGLPRPAFYDNSVLDTMDDKGEFQKVMRKAGLPTPAGGSTAIFSGALNIFRSIKKPVIVKPRTGSRGRHSTTFIYNEAELRNAFSVAKQLCFWVIVQEQLFGPVYRATVINFKTQGVLRGDSPSVTGDGRHTVAELVAKKNSALHAGVRDIVLDDNSRIFLSRQGLGENALVRQGQIVTLSEKIGVRYGGSSSEDYAICHPDNFLLFEQAAKALCDPIVGFDFIIEDISKSYKEQKTGFIEANSLPFINLHHDPLLGTPRNVAATVWDLVGF